MSIIPKLCEKCKERAAVYCVICYKDVAAKQLPRSDRLAAECSRLRAENAALRHQLWRIEWVDDGDDIGWHCPWCGNYEHAGHADDCGRQVALGASDEEGA